MLEKEEVRSWTAFAIGAGKILMFRGPDAYETEFERSMLISYLGFIFIESLFRNKDCFLEGERWTRALKGMAVTEPPNSERHENVIELWIDVFPLARLFHQTTDYIMYNDAVKPGVVLDIVLECYELRRKHIDWRARYGAFTRQHNACTGGSFKAREFCAVSFASQLLVDRFIIALEPLSPGAKDLEIEVQEMADMIALMYDEAKFSEDWQCDLLMARKTLFSQGARDTKDDWEKALDGDEDCLSNKGTLSKELFAEWNQKMGRDYESKGCYQTMASPVL
jgi:hypothetical protein